MSQSTYRVLVLTDHRKHSEHNSLYSLVRAMFFSDRCITIDIASRGVKSNHAFFYEKDASQLYAVAASSDFHYEATGGVFSRGIRQVAIDDYNFVFLRLPRPTEDSFLAWLPKIFNRHVFVNHPEGILKTSTKAFMLQFPELCPPMKLCYSEVIQKKKNSYLQ